MFIQRITKYKGVSEKSLKQAFSWTIRRVLIFRCFQQRLKLFSNLYPPTHPPTHSLYFYTQPQQQQADEPPPPPTVAAAAGDHQKQRRVTYPVLTDERNIRTSTHVNQFNVTTRMREIPLVNIFHKKSTTTLHLHHHRTRSPSSRGVRASAITGRSLFSALSK